MRPAAYKEYNYQRGTNAMLTIGLFAIIKRNYGLIMDADKNPLFALPPAQRFQTMVYLGMANFLSPTPFLL
jgi:hypothetical protein